MSGLKCLRRKVSGLMHIQRAGREGVPDCRTCNAKTAGAKRSANKCYLNLIYRTRTLVPQYIRDIISRVALYQYNRAYKRVFLHVAAYTVCLSVCRWVNCKKRLIGSGCRLCW